MKDDTEKLEGLRARFMDRPSGEIQNPRFARVAETLFSSSGTRVAPYAGRPTFLSAPARMVDPVSPDFSGLDVALVGMPMDLGVTNRPGARFGPRALRDIERIGPYNHVLDCVPVGDLQIADIGDVPFRSRYGLEESHADIAHWIGLIADAGVVPISVGGDHSITHPILRALGRDRSVGLIHIDAHCDTSGSFDGTKFHHGGPFRNAVLDGVLDPERTIQIGIRGSSEYLWEFSEASGMTVVHAEEMTEAGIPDLVRRARDLVGDKPTYLSFDIDSLDPAYAPGTGTPEVGGLTSREALALLRGMKGLNLIGADIVEVAPQYDATTNTAQVGGQVLFELASLMCFSTAIGQKA